MLMFDEIRIYMDEFENYVEGSEDYFEYYTQRTEINARLKEMEDAGIFIDAIEEYLKEEEK